jgi:hypothetical protein
VTSLDSRAVCWSPVWDLLAPILGTPGLIPGTPAWVALPDDNPDKWRAVLWACLWWVVAEDAHQDAKAEASRAISAAADWAAASRELQQLNAARRNGGRIERKTA